MNYHDRTLDNKLERFWVGESGAFTDIDYGEIVIQAMSRDIDSDIEETD